MGGWWVALIGGALVLLVLLIFVLQNDQRVQVSFLGWQAYLPLGVALLLAAIGGILAVAIPGTARILQLRRAALHPSPPRSQASHITPAAAADQQPPANPQQSQSAPGSDAAR
ncbi:lipopolysaccharide assembly protein LapA domain-containing protein [Nonomuraea sp. NPDC049152]|uniref:LapA family protein n=1 Tax=Nonomuraea sp. NPDC049152 TaxID=3154350 RepID=UPI0034022B6A